MLWIATQDRKTVINVKEITVNGKKIKGIAGKATLDEWDKDLGKYDSNERALEVLNDIFTKIDENNGYSVLYKMPEQ